MSKNSKNYNSSFKSANFSYKLPSIAILIPHIIEELASRQTENDVQLKSKERISKTKILKASLDRTFHVTQLGDISSRV